MLRRIRPSSKIIVCFVLLFALSGCLERTAQIAGGAVVGAAVGAVVTTAINNWGNDDASDPDDNQDRRDRSERRNRRSENHHERRSRNEEDSDSYDSNRRSDSDRYEQQRSVGGGEPARFQGIVSAHNQVRRSVGVSDLVWSSSVAAQAQSWADELGERNCQMEHSRSQYGENLAWASGTRLTPSRVVQMWADEKSFYDEQRNECVGGECGHYTQVVWGDSKQVGCGVVRCGNAEVWVCNYNPPGNYRGKRPY
ncbi:pathogenesis-related protein 1 [Azospirillaceae bacterium]